MRVLLTRPAVANQSLANRLTNLGHDVTQAPLFDEVTVVPTWPEGRPDALICTSARAPAIITRADLCDVPLYPIGPATAAAALAAGFHYVMPDAGGERTRLLAQIIANRPAISWWPSGEVSAGDLVAELANAGLHCLRFPCYRMIPTTWLPASVIAQLQAHTLDLVVLLSPAASRHWLDLLARHAIDARWLTAACLSDAVAEPLRLQGWSRLRIAAQPVLDSLLAVAGLTCNMTYSPAESPAHG